MGRTSRSRRTGAERGEVIEARGGGARTLDGTTPPRGFAVGTRSRVRAGRWRTWIARGAVTVGVVGLSVMASSGPVAAHPLGNFTTNTSASIQVRPDEVDIAYAVDLAEIPAFRARRDIDTNGDDELGSAERSAYASATCAAAVDGLEVTVDGRAVPMEVTGTELAFADGQAGLSTLRLECALRGAARVGDERSTIEVVDGNFDDKLGWREIVAVGDRTTIVESDVAAESISGRLTEYPDDRLSSPLRELDATVEVVPGGPAADGDETESGSPIPSADRLTALVSERRLTVPFGLFALAVSFVLGAFHALAPGHGKTVMAAYLVGGQGTRRQALLLGATVAVTHTGGVFGLALVVSNSSVAPERLYPYLGTASGLLVAGIGVALFRRAVQFRRIFPTLAPGASRHHHHGLGGHTHDHIDTDHAADHADDDHADHAHAPDHAHALAHAADHGSHDHGSHDHGSHDHGSHDHTHKADQAFANAADHGSHDHDHDSHEHDHDHDSHVHDTHDRTGPGDPGDHGAGAVVAEPRTGPAMRARNMMAMGFAGGLVPSPSALVVLLGSIAIGRAWFGFVLIVAYGLGLAAVLVGAGLLIERLRHRVAPLLGRRSHPRLTGLAVNLPIVTASLVIVGGAYLVARALAAA
jgi:ABC-type nickel/cobalt efflux system permease component RcnA